MSAILALPEGIKTGINTGSGLAFAWSNGWRPSPPTWRLALAPRRRRRVRPYLFMPVRNVLARAPALAHFHR